ncbi:hypothetical protein [uncultured Amnibacterium sp.]|uniref:hypothetical protein n=1 Tax=uncultured Amnibacterium sp. TaxID=1631851 RepID=UPI0035CC17E6
MPDLPVTTPPRTALFCTVLIAAPLLEVVEALISPLANGTTEQDIASIATSPTRFVVSVLIGTLGTFLLLPALLGLARRASTRSPKLAFAAAIAGGTLALTFSGIRLGQAAELAAATGGLSPSAAAHQFDQLTGNAIGATFLTLFLVSNIVGVVLLGIALWRSRLVPIPAIVLFLLFPVLDFALPTHFGAAASHLVLTISFTWMAIALLRSTPARRPAKRDAAREAKKNAEATERSTAQRSTTEGSTTERSTTPSSATGTRA